MSSVPSVNELVPPLRAPRPGWQRSRLPRLSRASATRALWGPFLGLSNSDWLGGASFADKRRGLLWQKRAKTC